MYFEGENTRELYLIKTGKVSLTKKFGIQNQVVIDSVGDGEFFGLIAAMKGSAQNETATVTEDAYIYSLKPVDFNELIARNLRIGFKLFSSLANTLRNYNRKIEKFTALENDSSTAERLLEIGEYYCNNNQPQQALYVYQKYLELYPESKLASEVNSKILVLKTE